jgi:hypothetical protein
MGERDEKGKMGERREGDMGDRTEREHNYDITEKVR